jgi:hypothetical protein
MKKIYFGYPFERFNISATPTPPIQYIIANGGFMPHFRNRKGDLSFV